MITHLSLCINRNEDSEMNPVQCQIVDKLREAYRDEAVFFWDETTGRELGVLLKPQFKAEGEFQVLNSKLRTFASEEGDSSNNSKMVANIPELLEQIVRVSEGLLVAR